MSMKIEYSPLAIRDLERLWAEVHEASGEAETAGKYVNDLMNCISRKREFPKSGAPLYYEGSFTGYYFVCFKAYIAFYRVGEMRMYVDRVVYAKSDYMRAIFENSGR